MSSNIYWILSIWIYSLIRFCFVLFYFNSNYFDYLETLIKYLKAVELCVKDTVYEFLSSVLRLFDDNSLGGAKSLNLIYELCFFCLDQNEKLCERFWAECKCEDRNNITVLLSNLLELFPISIEKTLRFLSLLAKTSVHLCEDVWSTLVLSDIHIKQLKIIFILVESLS